MSDPSAGFCRLLEIFHRLRIPYMVGGSLASSVHGVFRSTADIDLIVDMNLEQAMTLVKELGSDFYSDEDTIREALGSGRSFNVIHLASAFKFDFFPLLQNPYYRNQFNRRMLEEFSVGDREPVKFYVATAEDILLAKLVWFKRGGEVSQRQWDDVRGIVTVRVGRLDLAYLRHWAQHLNVEDLLERALSGA